MNITLTTLHEKRITTHKASTTTPVIVEKKQRRILSRTTAGATTTTTVKTTTITTTTPTTTTAVATTTTTPKYTECEQPPIAMLLAKERHYIAFFTPIAFYDFDINCAQAGGYPASVLRTELKSLTTYLRSNTLPCAGNILLSVYIYVSVI